ncbi:LEM-3-like GIY-YIG domain-containing protein [Aquisalinus luteolus]|nr:hypothetical protein GCM10011355_15520 [Aquisalinus luteolus]
MLNPLRKFDCGVAEKLGCYVYRYVHPESGDTFYIGRGQHDRVFQHLADTEKAMRLGKTLTRKEQAISDVWASGKNVHIVIQQHSLSDNEARAVETALIDLYPLAMNERKGDRDRKYGASDVGELNAALSPEEIKIDFPCIVVYPRARFAEARPTKFSLIDADKLYEVSRSSWVCDPTKENRRNIQFAVSFANGVIREIYEITNWHQVQSENNRRRWEFNGLPSSQYREFIGKRWTPFDVSSQWQCKWLNEKDALGPPVPVFNIEGARLC